MKLWDSFLPLMSPHLPGCPIPSMKAYLATTAADFLARSQLWRDNIDAVYVAPNLVEYDLSGDAVIEDVLAVWHDQKSLTRTDIRLIPDADRSKTGEPLRYWVQSDTMIRLHPIPTERVKLNVVAVLKTSRDATGVDDWIYETWADPIVSGAVAQLADLPDKEWSNPAIARTHKDIFERGIVRARTRDYRGVARTVRIRPAA